MTQPLPGTSTPGVVNLGTCWGTPGGRDLSTPSYMAQGWQCVGEAVARRWSTPRGQNPQDPNYGTDASDMLNDDLSPAEVSYWQQQLAAEAIKDERVRRASVTVTLLNGACVVSGVLTTAAGPFRLVVAVGAVTSTILVSQP